MALKKQSLNTGFGSNTKNEGNRLINKDGTFNTEKKGLAFFERFSLFHSLTNMSWLSFFGVMLFGYIVINVIFATIYMLLGTEGISGVSTAGGVKEFLDTFFFSSQTLTTVGYGAMSPESTSIGIVSSFESFIGLSGFALATGLLYGRFSKPKAKLIYSNNALVAPYKDIKGLMIRVANQRDSQIINLKAKLAFSLVKEGKARREFFFLPLEMDMINLLASSWTIVHPIDENSPLKNLTYDQMLKTDIEVLLFLEGYDETYAQNIHSRTSFKGSEILFNKKFKRILGQTKNGKASVALDQLSSVEDV